MPKLTVFLLLTLFASDAAAAGADHARLAEVLAAQPEDIRARYVWRHPQETLAFFGVAPGMTVVEALPGGGWYTKILLPYLGADGRYAGADYAADMFPLFGFFPQDFIEKKKTWPADFAAEARGWAGEGGPAVSAFAFGSMPEELKSQADVVLFVRALHNLARFEQEGGYLTQALQDAFDALKPGGILGVVQHEARADMSDDWAGGASGYLKRDFVIARLERAGFEYLGAIEVNQNPQDQPGSDDVVWRLPPTLMTSREQPELQARLEAVGESNRMTLKFRKPL